MTRQTIVLTLLVRDEVDIVADMLRWHLSQGVDHVVAMDNGSTDGTTEVLEDFAAAGVLTRIAQPSDAYLQDRWTTEMAHLARDRFGADWVIPSDADEFWMPDDPARSLRVVLEDVSAEAQMAVCGRMNLCAPWDDIDTLGWRAALIWRAAAPVPVPPARLRDPAPLDSPFAYAAIPSKAILRPGALTRIGRGAHPHDITMERDAAASDIAVTIHHAPFRDRDELSKSIARIATAIAADGTAGPDVSAKYRRWHAMAADGGLDPVLSEIMPDRATLERDRLSGRIRADTRLRDVVVPRGDLAARLALAGAGTGPDTGPRDALLPPLVVLLLGGSEPARWAVAARLRAAGVRPIDAPADAPIDWPDRIAAVMRGMRVEPETDVLAELRAGQAMHPGHWHGLLLDDPETTAAIPIWRALRDGGDIAPVAILLADAEGASPDLETATRGLPRLIATSDRILNASAPALHAALGCLGLSPPLSIALASRPADTDPVAGDPDLIRKGWGLPSA